ncbi:unnamed protein product, partial [Mesorhabditis belari]|uniref:Acyl-coenzyme A thioesterase 13 n=1 Tax=Mesorhabditis belari TaxID=2138241 RepID=A0AAF3FGR4_9BILA
MAGRKFVEMLSELYKGYGKTNTFMKTAGVMKVLSADAGKVRVEFDVTEELTNSIGTLHGGCTATLVDVATNTALRTLGKKQGVSVDLHVSFLGAAKLGETVVMDIEVIKAGRSMAFSRADLYVKGTDRKIATGNHTKALVNNQI